MMRAGINEKGSDSTRNPRQQNSPDRRPVLVMLVFPWLLEAVQPVPPAPNQIPKRSYRLFEAGQKDDRARAAAS